MNRGRTLRRGKPTPTPVERPRPTDSTSGADVPAAIGYIESAQGLLDSALAALKGTTPPEPNPPVYSTAITDRLIREKPPLPELGPAGEMFIDPAFDTSIIRVTDGTMGGSSWRVASNAHVASWNADCTRFYLLGPTGKQVFECGAGVVRPLTMISSQCEPTFSRNIPTVLYGVGGPVTRTIQAIILGPTGVEETQDLLNLDTLGLGISEPRTYVGGLVSSDVSLAIFFGGQGQDDHHYAGVLLEGETELAYMIDTLTEPGLGFKLHSIAIDHSGRFVVLYPVQAKPYHMVIWDTEQGTFAPVTVAPWGHDTQGYGWEVNHDTAPNGQAWDAGQWVIRKLDVLDEVEDLITPVQTPKETYMDDHTSWHNARSDALLPVITATYRYNNEQAPWRAWDDEIIAIATDGPSTVYRFCHHRSDARDETSSSNTYFWYQPIPSVSPDGKWVLFHSNWEKTLGSDPNDAGRSRQDVFLVKLPS